MREIKREYVSEREIYIYRKRKREYVSEKEEERVCE